MLVQDNTGIYYSPAIDATGFSEALIYVSSTEYGTVEIMISDDSMSWSNAGSMVVESGGRSAYRLPVTTKFFRYSVDTGGTVESSVALI